MPMATERQRSSAVKKSVKPNSVPSATLAQKSGADESSTLSRGGPCNARMTQLAMTAVSDAGSNHRLSTTTIIASRSGL